MTCVRILTSVAIIAATMIFPAAVQAQDSGGEDAPRTTVVINTQHTLSQDDGYEPALMLILEHPVLDNLAVACFAWASPAWGEGYCGIATTLGDWLRVAVYFGLETAEVPVRAATQLTITAGPFTLTGVVEGGGSGVGYDARMLFRITEHLQLGLMGQRGQGEGILLRIDYGRVGFSFGYLYDIEKYLTSDRSNVWYSNRYWTTFLEFSVRVSP
ncbi:MAG: hypothetical protein U9Q03_05855 [Patescibacteria group bacterium]|nr:hypothetical protein [Patescibacteria group bacterium]